MVKTSGKRSAVTAGLTVMAGQERVVKVDRGLQSLMDYGDNMEVPKSQFVEKLEIHLAIYFCSIFV